MTIGYYSGADFLEETFIADLEYFIPENRKFIELECEKTRDGYGVVKTDNLPNGKYILMYSGVEGWFEIKR